VGTVASTYPSIKKIFLNKIKKNALAQWRQQRPLAQPKLKKKLPEVGAQGVH
jgi:hypothetical protein